MPAAIHFVPSMKTPAPSAAGAVARALRCAGLLALLFVAWPGVAQTDGMALAKAVHGRPEGRDATSVSRMELTEKGRAPRVRNLVTYRLNRGTGESAILIRFLGPKDIAGTGLLSVEKADGGNDQWLYLPALDRVRRVAGDRKGGRFVGSDLYYEDLQERKPGADKHRIIGRETVNGVVCDVLESVPADPAESIYRKRVSWVDPETLLLERIDLYESDDATPSKRFTLLAKKREKGFWTVMDSKMVDLGTGHETRLVLQSIAYDRKLPPKLFTQQSLADERAESEFRP